MDCFFSSRGDPNDFSNAPTQGRALRRFRISELETSQIAAVCITALSIVEMMIGLLRVISLDNVNVFVVDREWADICYLDGAFYLAGKILGSSLGIARMFQSSPINELPSLHHEHHTIICAYDHLCLYFQLLILRNIKNPTWRSSWSPNLPWLFNRSKSAESSPF